MKIAIATLLALLVPSLVEASTSCTTRRSGSVEIVSCSSSGHNARSTTCRSYWSGRVKKTTCS